MVSRNQVIAASCGSAAFSIILLALLAAFIYIRQKPLKRAAVVDSEAEPSVFVPQPHDNFLPLMLFGPTATKHQLRSKAYTFHLTLAYIVSGISDEAIPSDPTSFATFCRLIEDFGPVPMQKSPKELMKLLKKRGFLRVVGVQHFLTTTIIACINPDSEARLSLLTPCLVDLHRLCRQPEMKTLSMFQRRHAELRAALGEVIPHPRNEQACKDLRNYLMTVLDGYWVPDELERTIATLDEMIQLAMELGNLLMVQPTTWRWTFGQDDPDIDKKIVTNPGFRCVLDEKGEPYTMTYPAEIVEERKHSFKQFSAWN